MDNIRGLLDQHLTELESHTRELIAMNSKLRKENEHLLSLLKLGQRHASDRNEFLLSLLASVNRQTSYTGVCPVCRALDDCEPSCDGLKIAKLFD